MSGIVESPTARSTPAEAELVLRHKLTQIWEELLAVWPIGVKDNFFDLGGDSFLAARLIQRMEQVCGKEIPLAALFAGATIEYLAKVLLEEQQAASRLPVVPIQAAGSKRPFFFLPGDSPSEGFWCLNVARDLESDQPFYVLSPHRCEGAEALSTLRAVGVAMVQALRAVRPEGPYALGGFSWGALVAYEMAQQLLAAGESVRPLVLINPAGVSDSSRVLAKLINCSGNLIGLSPARRFRCFLPIHLLYRHVRQNRPQPLHAALKNEADQTVPEPSAVRSVFPTAEEVAHDWTGRYSWMAAESIPRPYPGKVTVFWSSEEPIDEPGAQCVAEQRALWQNLMQAEESEIFMIPGTRSSCRTHHAAQLAAQLSACLQAT